MILPTGGWPSRAGRDPSALEYVGNTFGIRPEYPAHTVNRWIIGETARARLAVDEALTSFRFNDAVLRHLTVLRDSAASTPSVMMKSSDKDDSRRSAPQAASA